MFFCAHSRILIESVNADDGHAGKQWWHVGEQYGAGMMLCGLLLKFVCCLWAVHMRKLGKRNSEQVRMFNVPVKVMLPSTSANVLIAMLADKP